MPTEQPTKEQLRAATERVCKRAEETVSRIPLEQRAIITVKEAEELERRRVARAPNR